MTNGEEKQTLKDTLKKRKIREKKNARLSLVVVATPDQDGLGQRYQLDGAEYVFGRASPHVAIEDPRMSKEHFRLRSSGQADYQISDMGTTNGTFLDGRSLAEQSTVSPHGVISAGDTLLAVDVHPPPQTLPAAASARGDQPKSIVGISMAASLLRRAIETVAEGRDPILLLGETGVGKEIAAEAIHALSDRSGPWIPVNCAAIPKELADSMLFGHAKGAFTGADEAQAGFFAKADGGTLFLDEIGELPTAVQAKLLRVLETGLVQELGGEARMVDVRVISATHQSVHDSDRFRADLYARLCDWVLQIPPLRERRADTLVLFSHFASIEAGQPVSYTPEFAEALLLHDWPRNVRELAKLAKRLVRLHGAVEFDLLMLPPELSDRVLNREEGEGGSALAPLTDPDARVSDAAPTRREMLELVERARGNIQAIARQNEWHRMQVYRWVKRYGINPADYR